MFGVGWAFLAVPALTSSAWFIALNPVLAYLVYNLGWFFLTTSIFGGLVAFLAFDKSRLVGMLKVGLSTWLFVSFVFDNFQPPFYLSPSGQVLIPLGTPALENEAVDAMLASVWGTVIPNVPVSVNLYLVAIAVLAILGSMTGLFIRQRKKVKETITGIGFLAVLLLGAAAYVAGVPAVQSVSLLYIFVYPVSAFVAVIAMALLMAPKKFVSLFYQSF